MTTTQWPTVAPAATPAHLDHLARSLRSLDLAHPLLNLRTAPDSGDWLGCAEVLARPALFQDWGERLAVWLRSRYAEAPPRVVHGYLMTWYLGVPASLAALLFHTERRVPSLRPADLSFRLATDRPHPDGIAVTSPRFACLPTDPAAGTTVATVVRDEAALARLLRAQFAGHAARFVAAFGPLVRFGRHTLWAAATDALDEALWLAGRHCGDENTAVVDAEMLLPTALAPFTSASTVRRDATGAWTRRRESCCFHYVLKQGIGPCETCPRQSCADRGNG